MVWCVGAVGSFKSGFCGLEPPSAFASQEDSCGKQISSTYTIIFYVVYIAYFAFQVLPEKYRSELLHVKMFEALENAKFQDRFDWIRETSFTGTVFDLKMPVDRAPIDGTGVAHAEIESTFAIQGKLARLLA